MRVCVSACTDSFAPTVTRDERASGRGRLFVIAITRAINGAGNHLGEWLNSVPAFRAELNDYVRTPILHDERRCLADAVRACRTRAFGLPYDGARSAYMVESRERSMKCFCGNPVSEFALRECRRMGLLPQCSRCLVVWFEFRQEERRAERQLMIEAQLALLVVLIAPRVPKFNRKAKRRPRTMLHGQMVERMAA
jgi:hypothetical protein